MMYTGKQLRALVMPLMFEQFLNVMVGMVDTLMVSKAGEAAVSGVEIAQTGQALLLKRVHRIRPHIPVEDAEQMLIRGVLIGQLKR